MKHTIKKKISLDIIFQFLVGGVLEARWHTGVHLGQRMESTEQIIGITDGTTVKARDCREVVEENAWNPEMLRKVIGTPYDPTGTLPAQLSADETTLPTIPELRPVDAGERDTRGLAFRAKHFEKIGYSPGCLKCRKMQRGERCRGASQQ